MLTNYQFIVISFPPVSDIIHYWWYFYFSV